MATRRFYRRRFLNRRGHHAGAYVLADCKVSSHRDDGAIKREVDADLTISDCSRVTTLDFSSFSVADARNSLYKARLLRAVVNEFTDALEDAIAEVHPDLD